MQFDLSIKSSGLTTKMVIFLMTMARLAEVEVEAVTVG